MNRLKEYFLEDNEEFPNININNTPPKFYRQERDWTCSIACLRTLLSGIQDKVESENEFIIKYKFEIEPHYSKDIKYRNIFTDDLKVIYGCDHKNTSIKQLFSYMEDGYYIMVESMYNYAHWFVLLGYYAIGDDPEKHKISIYDPYYDEVRFLNADEFSGMWLDGDHEKTKVYKDFIAIRKN